MAASSSKSLKDYLKRYETNNEEEKKKKKKKKQKAKPDATGVLVVDEDPVWQKPVVLEEENDNDSADEEKPQVNEDIEVKRMRRLEQLRAKRGLNDISEDGSGWVTLSPKHSNMNNSNSDLSPPRKRTARNDTLSPEPGLKRSGSGEGSDLLPPRQRGRRHTTPSPEPDMDFSLAPNRRVRYDTPSPEHGGKPRKEEMDLSPPRRGRARNDTRSPEHNRKPVKEGLDLLPPRRGRARNDTPSPSPNRKPVEENLDMPPPRRGRARNDTPSPERYRRTVKEDVDLSLSQQRRKRHHTPSPEPDVKSKRPSRVDNDISPPRRRHRDSPLQADLHTSPGSDLSPPRKSRNDDLSPPRKNRKEASVSDTKEQRKTGLISGRDISEEIARTKKQDLLRFQEMDPSISGRGAEPVYRDKIKGERITKEEYLKSRQKVEEKPKEIKLEWGKGLAQKREAEARLQELEREKDKPFARSRDDPELDEMLKDRVRWGDPMAHLVKRKQHEHILPNLGDNEKMKESGFIIPQDIPNHSWSKRGLDAAPNRYGIKPGRHWDGVDRSNGYEKELFKRMNEKRATEREAYLWSVSDM